MSDNAENPSGGTREPGRPDWRGEYAYTAGVQAFIYGFPYIYYAQLRHAWVTNKRDPEVVPYAAVNHFWHAGRLLDASYRDGGSPSTDSLYSFAWLDLRREPVILSHPDMGERYFTFQLAGFTSDNFGYVGQRTTGTAAGDFAIVGPGWEGDLPPGVRRLEQAPTPWVLVLGRTAVNGRRGSAQGAGVAAAVPVHPAQPVGRRRGSRAGAPGRLRPGAGVGPVGTVEDAQRDAGREPAAAPSAWCWARSGTSASARVWTSRPNPLSSRKHWPALPPPGARCCGSSSSAVTGP